VSEEQRPAIPEELRRAVLIEAGHRCAIPTCHATTTEVAHIVPWAKVRDHRFENLIALCPNCHTRFDKGEIDRKAMLQYKANIGVLNGRYSDLERRLLFVFARTPDQDRIGLPGGMAILLLFLVIDGYLTKLPAGPNDVTVTYGGVELVEWWKLTENGRQFVRRWATAQGID